jgi:2-oxo-4-hydroxy-4-carboxy-5-ureidoimidazoline decarboxylase
MSGDARPEAVAALNAWSADEARRALTACCASRRWVAAIAQGRPYGGWTELASAANAAMKALRWSDVLEALDAHPRIGDQAAGESREAKWSRAEQSVAAGGAEPVLREVALANAEYERVFGHVFLIRAAGRSAEEILAAARERLGHDADAERQVVRAELAEIVLLRLESLAGGPAAADEAAAGTPTGVTRTATGNRSASSGVKAGVQDSAESAAPVTGAAK